MLARTQYNPDAVAKRLCQIAQLARKMPPAYLGAGVTQPVVAEEHRVGWVLPGEGLLLNVSLRRLGITRSLPFVYERDLVARLADWFGDERGAVGTYQALVAARMTGANDVACPPGIGGMGSSGLWGTAYRTSGGVYTAGSGGTRNNQSTGATRITDPGSGLSKYLVGWGMFCSNSGATTAMLVDVLVAFGTLDPTITTLQTVNSVALTRYTSGAGVLLAFETVNGPIGSTPATITVIYTNQAGTAGQVTTQNMLTSVTNKTLQPATGPFIPLASGDFGLRSVASVQFSANMGGTATIGGLIYRPLAVMPVDANAGILYERNLTKQIDGLTILPVGTDNHVGFFTLFVLLSSNQGFVGGVLRTVQA